MWNDTPFTRRLGLRYPIVQGPFGGGMSSAVLAATVSNAGGLGSFGAERWGRALVFVVDQSPLGERGDGLLAEILQSAIHSLIDKHARVLKLHREGVRVRFLAVSGAAVQGVRARLDRGESWGNVLVALHTTPAGGEA